MQQNIKVKIQKICHFFTYMYFYFFIDDERLTLTSRCHCQNIRLLQLHSNIFYLHWKWKFHQFYKLLSWSIYLSMANFTQHAQIITKQMKEFMNTYSIVYFIILQSYNNNNWLGVCTCHPSVATSPVSYQRHQTWHCHPLI